MRARDVASTRLWVSDRELGTHVAFKWRNAQLQQRKVVDNPSDG